MTNKKLSEKSYKDSPRRGIYYEHRLRDKLKLWGIACKSFRRSGQIKKGKQVADLKIFIDDSTIRIENKMRAKKTFQRFYNMIETGDRYIEDFGYALTEESFRKLVVDKIPPNPRLKINNGTKLLEEFFSQDDADIVSMVSPWSPYIFMLKPHTYDYLLSRCIEEPRDNLLRFDNFLKTLEEEYKAITSV